jgi:ketosteroid isomerase-like protein
MACVPGSATFRRTSTVSSRGSTRHGQWENDRVVASGGIRFRARESGVDMAERMGWVYEFRNGLVRRMMFYGSWSEALEAVGLRE